ncbi:Organic cation/carnitine transporter 3 [Rhynchospora pubera]|uniref:H(+)/Pi cotransporter n=1 Tax=Rhynchospora pubera TaxID=906938 RepID=A0AAV8GJ25_9POAL|nr:Organic cation/carnitine transporter 3 [Rhynchospora pubera]
MVDATPLLPPLNPSVDQSTNQATMLQLLQSIVVAAAWFIDGQQTFITVFTDADPDWKCLDPVDPMCKSASSPCGLQPGSWAWYPAGTSIVSEWGLECADKILLSLPASAFFAGCVFSSLITSTLADSVLGRKLLLVLSCLVMSLGGAATVLSPNIWVYSALKFISGFGRGSLGSSSLVLSMEIADQWWRDKIGVLGFTFYMLGFLTLPMMAYNMGQGLSWRLMYLWTNVPSLCYTIFLFFFVQESPRWLRLHQQNEDNLTQQDLLPVANYDFLISMKMLCRNKQVLWRLIAGMLASFGVGFVYFGLPFSLGDIGLNLYLSVALNALSELPASILTLLLVATMDRRSSVLILTTLSGLCSLACVFETVGIASKFQLAAEVISYCTACTAINVMLIYCVELFPTTIRSTAISLVRITTLLAGVFGPVLAAQGKSSKFWSFGVFGLAIGFCGLPLTFLPETKGKDLADHIQDEEQVQRTGIAC